MKGIKEERLTNGDCITRWTQTIKSKREFQVEKIHLRKVVKDYCQ